MMPTKHVIIGNGAAGVSCARKIKELAPDAQVTIITMDDQPFYYRPSLPHIVSGETTREQVVTMSTKDFEAEGINMLLGERVDQVLPEESKLKMVSGDIIEYDQLLLATGAWPRRLEVEGSDLEGVVNLRTMDDALGILASAESIKRVVVVGAGLLGADFIQAFRKRGLKVHVVMRGRRFWAEMLDAKGSQMVEERILADGVTAHKEVEIARVIGESRVTGVELTDGTTIDCDLVAAAIGVTPNLRAIDKGTIKTDRGILVDQFMRTNFDNIYAAGDCAQAYDVVYDEYLLHTSWRMAQTQGEMAGQNMLGKQREYIGGIPSNTIEIYGLSVTTMGFTDPHELSTDYEIFLAEDPDRSVYKKYILKDNVLVGATFITDNAEAEIAEALITEKADMSLIKDGLVDTSFSFEPFLTTNIKIICPVCKANISIPLGSKEGDTLVCPVCNATLRLKDRNGILVPEEVINPGE